MSSKSWVELEMRDDSSSATAMAIGILQEDFRYLEAVILRQERELCELRGRVDKLVSAVLDYMRTEAPGPTDADLD